MMKTIQIGVSSLIAAMILIPVIGFVYADTSVPAVPEIQGLSTGTSSNVVGTVTETDYGAWTTTNDPFVIYTYQPTDVILVLSPSRYQTALAQLQSAGGSIVATWDGSMYEVNQVNIPESLMDSEILDFGSTWGNFFSGPGIRYKNSLVTSNGLHSGILDPGQVQYTTGYNDQYAGVSGQQSFVRSMAVSTANKIADQSNIKVNTNIQYNAVDTGRATRTEDLLLDGASQAQDSSGLILCPFANANPEIIPAFCNIEQAGSAFDTTFTSTVTSADTRFVGTDASIPTDLNYNINAQGITLGNQSSPMIGSISAFLKVHVQEARNESTISGSIPFDEQHLGSTYSLSDSTNPMKSEDLTYSETSTASGLISRFSKSMSYTSQASAVSPPKSVVNIEIEPF